MTFTTDPRLVEGASEATRNGETVDYVALDISNLPTASVSEDIALVTGNNEYVQDLQSGEAFDIETAALTQSIAAQDATSLGLTFSDDGVQMYESGLGSSKIYQSSLSTPFDIGTATFQKSISSQDSTPHGIVFADAGNLLFECGTGQNKIYQSSLSTPFDIATASFQTSINSQTTPFGLALSNTGEKLFEIGDKIYESELSTPFDISTASFTQSINTQDSSAEGIVFSNDGSRLFTIGRDTDFIFQSGLSTPFDISTAQAEKTIASQDSKPRDLAFNDQGTRLYEIGQDGPGPIFESEIVIKPEWQIV